MASSGTEGGAIVERFFEDYLDRLRELHQGTERAIEGLPQEALDWVPGAQMNSMAVLVMHLTGAERFWIGDVVAHDPSDRDRATEFRVRGLGTGVLQERLAQTLAYLRSILTDLSLSDLADLRISPRSGAELTVGWALAHVLEHTAQHCGHIAITRQLWGQREP